MIINISNFSKLIEDFLENKISVHQFERNYIDQYTDNEGPLSEEAFQILDWLFFQVDAFTDLPIEPADNPDHYINEDQLRESATKTLQKLQDLK